MPISVPVSLLTCVCVCYNGALALWHLRYIINLKAWIISCRCTPGNQGGDDGVVDGGRGVGGTAGVFVWVCAGGGGGGSWVTCCCWLAHNISKYMTSTWLLYLVYIARLLDFFFLNFFQETGFKVLRKEKRPFRPSIPPRSCHCQ